MSCRFFPDGARRMTGDREGIYRKMEIKRKTRRDIVRVSPWMGRQTDRERERDVGLEDCRAERWHVSVAGT